MTTTKISRVGHDKKKSRVGQFVVIKWRVPYELQIKIHAQVVFRIRINNVYTFKIMPVERSR